MKIFMLLLLLAAVLYMAVIALLYTFQGKLIYPNNYERASNILADAPAPYRNFPVTTPDGIDLRGWYVPAKPGMPTIVYFHGNADHLVKLPAYHDTIVAQGFGMLLTSYRGYSGHKGTPNEQGLYMDAETFLRALIASGVDQKNIIIYGFSLGTGVATEMATRFAPKALVLGAPFASLSGAAGYRYGWIPVDALLRDRYDNLRKIARIDAPILIVNGRSDTVFPASEGEILAQAARPGRVTYKSFDGDHVDFFFDHGGKEFIADWLRDQAAQ